ncbi:hypothetical protein KR222_011314, partial [Zaprionus bogoriensis]
VTFKMWYQPRQKDGKLVKPTWPNAFYRRANPIAWPLEDYPSDIHTILDRLIILFGFLVFIMHTEVDIHYLFVHLDGLEKLSSSLPTIIVQIEMDIKCFQLAMRKTQLKKLLQYFYTEIYISPESDKDSFERIRRQNTLPRIIAIFYTMTLINFFQDFTKNNLNGRRVMLYPQEYIFDNTWLPVYIPLICLNFWEGLLVDTILFGELNILGELMMHLNARYQELGKDLRLAAKRLLESCDATNIAEQYRKEVIQVLRRNNTLNSFAREIENQFTFRIFISFSFSSLTLCVLLFKCYEDPLNNLVFMVWFIAKFFEQFTYGYLGSILYETTNKIDKIYYCGDWEQIVYHSTNTRENVKLMKLIALSIQLHSKPFHLTGLKHFRVTLVTVIKVGLRFFLFSNVYA